MILVAALFGMTLSSAALADPCVVDEVGGTVELPPIGCDYLSPEEVHLIIDGLPVTNPPTTIVFKPIHKDFICYEQQLCSAGIPPGLCEAPGGGLGGNADCFDSVLEFEVKGTGLLNGFNRTLSIPTFTEVHTGPRNAGDPVQTFPTEMVQLQANLFGDPDFDTLNIRAGSLFGLPSPGETTLTLLDSGKFQVDSFFDITYQIDFVGAPGSILEGLAGSTVADLTMASGVNPCDVVDNGTGTIDLPPAGCEYWSALPNDIHRMIDGLPPGTTIRLDMIHRQFFCGIPSPQCTTVPIPGTCEQAGGSLGGNIDCFQSTADLTIEGTGALAGFSRTISVPLDTEVHTGPRNPGDPVQDFPSTMFRLQGEIFGDPDFCVLNIRAGDQNGLPGPGHTTLTDKGNGTFAVDSFFDVSYEIDFVGCPGSILEGMGGTTFGTVRMQTGDPITADEIPGITGGWLWLFGGLLALTSIWGIRQYATTA
jgi:hypothetical protein